MTEHPWLILTLRRTGGTSLTTFLSAASNFPTIEHEPFNPARTLGHITKGFRQTEDAGAMTGAIQTALAKRPNIKHCIEIIPLDLTRALIDSCNDLGYRFIVMTRRDEARRLASLFLAVATGAWGPDAAEEIYPQIISGDLTPEPIDLARIQHRVSTDYHSVGRTLALLRNRRIDYRWLLFEELYFGDTPVEEQARALAAGLGMQIAADDERLLAFAERSGQKSSTIAPYVENYDEAVARLDRLCSI